jgi:hypothetical protein
MVALHRTSAIIADSRAGALGLWHSAQERSSACRTAHAQVPPRRPVTGWST